MLHGMAARSSCSLSTFRNGVKRSRTPRPEGLQAGGGNVGPQFDPKDADYIEVQRGGYSADYGDRTYGLFNVVPRTGFERNNEGEIRITAGTFHQTNDQLSFGSHTQRFAYYASFNGNRSDYGLSAPVHDVIHDQDSGAGGFSSLI